ncbi:MAG: hypothetical protein D6761_09225 [Candidatus Dadabacteria bacterium]|nr:MAG: hypothetical protein D6761_09225 [Candidatus Dadabacteria bacterium]
MVSSPMSWQSTKARWFLSADSARTGICPRAVRHGRRHSCHGSSSTARTSTPRPAQNSPGSRRRWTCCGFPFAMTGRGVTRIPTHLILLLTTFILSLPCATEAAPGGYVLGPGDRLSIRVYPDDHLAPELTVRTDGTIMMPLIGAVPASGATVPGLTATIQKQLEGRFYRAPSVEIDVVRYVSHRAFVLGSVREPGGYPLYQGDRVLDLLQRAGGISGASIGFAYLFTPRPGQGAPEVQQISLRRVFEAADPAHNLAVPNGATIYVYDQARVFVMGAVERAGSYEVSEGGTLLRVIATAGGFSARASTTKIRIYRGSPVKVVEVDASAIIKNSGEDPVVMPGDLIYVPQRFF